MKKAIRIFAKGLSLPLIMIYILVGIEIGFTNATIVMGISIVFVSAIILWVCYILKKEGLL